MPQPDILLFFSDQHHARYSGFAGHPVVETPNLDRLAQRGTVFSCAYTAAPLCVPGRSAMLTGQLPSHSGIYTNGGIVPSDQATFLHSLAARGYETVLCGRMHFKGPDQRHGFSKRIFGDITPVSGTDHQGWAEELGPYAGGKLGMGGCVDIIGGGNSPVLEYDRAVMRAAREYLAQDHERPQCIVVGTYGPHFPYVAPPELYRQYREQVSLPDSWRDEGDCRHPMTEKKKQRTRVCPETGEEQEVTEEDVLAARAAYFGMITQLDAQIGEVRESWEAYLDRMDRDGVFIYTSDHGDTCGEHGIFGKQTFFEGSAAIPMIFEGTGVDVGAECDSPASIMDVGPTLCELTGATPPPAQDGASLAASLRGAGEPEGRYVLCEFIEGHDGEPVPGRMIRRGRWKLITYAHPDGAPMLFDVENDPAEINDLSADHPDVVEELRSLLAQNWEVDRIVERHIERCEQRQAVARGGGMPPVPEEERWTVDESARKLPETR